MSSGNNTRRARPQSARFLIRLTAWGSAVLLFLTVPAIIALHAPSIQKEIILTAVTRIEAATNLRVQIGSYRWWPFSGIYLTGVKIESDGKQILGCDKVRLDYKLSIERPHINIEKVYLERPILQLERSADGKWIVPAPPGDRGVASTGDGASEPLWTPAQLPRIQIVSGTIEARQQGNTILCIKDISCAVHLKAVPGVQGPKIQMDFENLQARAQIGQSGTWGINGSGMFDGQRLQVPGMILSGPNNCRVQVRGEWDVKNIVSGKAKLIITDLSADTVPFLQPDLSGLSAVSGSISVTRSEGRWSFEHDISTDLG